MSSKRCPPHKRFLFETSYCSYAIAINYCYPYMRGADNSSNFRINITLNEKNKYISIYNTIQTKAKTFSARAVFIFIKINAVANDQHKKRTFVTHHYF